MLTWHSRLQDRSEGGGFLLALDINIFTCCDVGPSWVYKQFHSLGIKKLHCFRDRSAVGRCPLNMSPPSPLAASHQNKAHFPFHQPCPSTTGFQAMSSWTWVLVTLPRKPWKGFVNHSSIAVEWDVGENTIHEWERLWEFCPRIAWLCLLSSYLTLKTQKLEV